MIGIPEVENLNIDTQRAEELAILMELLPEITNLNSGGLARRLLELQSQGHHGVYRNFAENFLPQAYYRTATDDWLDAKARDVGLKRLTAVKAEHWVKFTREDATGNALIPINGMVATSVDTSGKVYRFLVKETVVAAAGQTDINVRVVAEQEGVASNVGAATITEMKTAFPGWDSITNEADTIIIEGRDIEEDGRPLEPEEAISATTGLRRRIGLQWQAANSCNWAAYELKALTAGARDVVVKQLRGGGGRLTSTSPAPPGCPPIT